MSKGGDGGAADSVNRQIDEANRERRRLSGLAWDDLHRRLSAQAGDPFAAAPGAPEVRPNGYNPDLKPSPEAATLNALASNAPSTSFAAQDAASTAV